MPKIGLWTLKWFYWHDIVGKFIKIPHTKPVERKIIYEFIKAGYLKGRYAFDVRLPPEDRPLRPGETPFDYEIWKALHSLRIDVVVEMPDCFWILEVKDRLRPSALGEVETYASLFPRKYDVRKEIRKGIVVGVAREDLRILFESRGIKVFVLNIPSRPKRIFI